MNFEILSAKNYSPSMVLHFISPTLIPEMSEEQENRVTTRSRNVNTATLQSCNCTQAQFLHFFFETLQVD